MSKREELRKKRQQEQRRQQVFIIGAVAVVALIAAGVLIWPNLQPVGAIVTAVPENLELADGRAIGPPDAQVVIQEFADFQCPFCRVFATTTESQLIDQLLGPDRSVRFEYRHFIVVDGNVGGSESRRAAEASECANEQGKFWEYHGIVFANQQGEGTGAFRDLRLKAFAETIGLDTAAFNACFDSGRYAQAVQEDHTLGQRLGVTGTPTMFVNGMRVENPLNLNEITQLVNAELAK
jgi:protein-disulfide isomerase